MCYSPLKITNNTRYFSAQHDKAFNTVPCGHCGECLVRKQNDWIVRSYFEWKNCVKNGGFGLFVTFTYAPEYLPLLFNDATGECIPTFNKRDVQLFNHALRKRLSRYYHQPIRYKYLFTSELGGKTFRPHYHALLFFPDTAKPHVVRQMINELWYYGHTKYGQNYGIINSFKGCRYVCKYITKDLDFQCKQYETFLNDFKTYDEDKYKEIINAIKPFHLNSQEFGINIITDVPFESIINGKIVLPSDSGLKIYNTPQYIDRKLFYDLDSETLSYRLNADGLNMRVIRSEQRKDYYIRYIQGLHTSLNTWLDTETVKLVNSYFGTSYTKDSLISKFNLQFKNGYSDFIDYLSNYRDYSYLDDVNLLPDKVSAPMSFKDRLKKYLSPSPIEPRYYDFSFNPISQYKIKSTLYNEIYYDLEKFAQLFDIIRFQYGKYRNNEFYRKYQKLSKSKLYK